MTCRRKPMLCSALRWTSALIMLASWIALPDFQTEAAPIIPETMTMYYLSQSGYLPPVDPSNKGNMRKEALSNGISRFQSSMGINNTGDMDMETAGLLKLPRCGVKEEVEEKNWGRKKRYVLFGIRWTVTDITYRISKYTEKLSRKDVDDEIARAFAVWSNYTNLKFTPESGEVDIDIRFERGDHGDGRLFDGNSGFLAHAFYPDSAGSSAGDIHFDDDEDWTLRSYRGQNLFQVAVHEIGHSLGLKHSKIPSSVMIAFARPYNPNFKLDEDDIHGIQKLYGKKTGYDVPDICTDPKIDTIFKSTEGQIFAFKGNYYWELTTNNSLTGNPRLISETWNGLPGDIDAAFTYTNGKTYFFKGSKYWRYAGMEIDEDYPRKITEGFPGIPQNLGAATMWTGDEKIYFFKGPEYWRFVPVHYRTSLLKGPEFIPDDSTLLSFWDAGLVRQIHISSLNVVLETLLRAEDCELDYIIWSYYVI